LIVTMCVAIDVPQLLITVYVMFATPPLIPVTTPPDTEAIAELLLLQVPPDAVSVNTIAEEPTHSTAGPEITPPLADRFTDIAAVATHEPIE